MTHKARRLQKNTRPQGRLRAVRPPAPRRCAHADAAGSLISGEEFQALMAVACGLDPAQTWTRSSAQGTLCACSPALPSGSA